MHIVEPAARYPFVLACGPTRAKAGSGLTCRSTCQTAFLAFGSGGCLQVNGGVRPQENMMSVGAFYDELAPLYHLVYEDWEGTVARQGRQLASLIAEYWGTGAHTVLDASQGIGTQ